MRAEVAIRWSTWAQTPAAARSFRTRQWVTAIAIGEDRDGEPLWVCGDDRGGVGVVDSHETATVLRLGGQRKTSGHTCWVAASTLGSRRLVAWADGQAIEARDLDRPDVRWPEIRIGLERMPYRSASFDTFIVGDIDERPIVAAVRHSSKSGSVTVWDVETGRGIAKLRRKRGRGVRPESIVLARTASGELVAVTGESDGTVCIWGLPGGKLRQRFTATGHGGITAVSAGVVGGRTIVAAVRPDTDWSYRLSQWHLEIQEPAGQPINLPWIDSLERVEALVISTLGGRPAVIGVRSVAGPFAFEIGTGEEIGIGVADRSPRRPRCVPQRRDR